MVKFIKKIDDTLSKVPLFFKIYVLDTLMGLSFGLFTYFFDIPDASIYFEGVEEAFLFFGMVAFAPFFETLIFQSLIINILLHYKVSQNIIVLASAIIFGVMHYYNIYYMITIFFVGILYAGYYLYIKEKGKDSAFLSVCALHALSNLTSFIINKNF